MSAPWVLSRDDQVLVHRALLNHVNFLKLVVELAARHSPAHLPVVSRELARSRSLYRLLTTGSRTPAAPVLVRPNQPTNQPTNPRGKP